ncbi:MAG: GerMN domain-containing protein [Clostridia bacterium]|nr:GerMN domain-containing protein [Clostridia bacterium]
MKKNRKKIITIITLILIVLLVVFIFNNISIENTEEKYKDYTPEEEISEEQMRQTKVILFFANNETGELESEIKVVDANLLINEPYKEIMNWLIKGPQSSTLKKLIPEGTALHDIKVEKSCAIINLSNEFLNYETEENKLKIINSIVNTLTNLKEIDSVKFLINGEENEKLSEIYLKNN